jgi:hypothetical protein
MRSDGRRGYTRLSPSGGASAWRGLDALLEILGPSWLAVFQADLSNKTPLRFLAAGYASPHTVKRLGKARLARFFSRHSRGRWGEEHARALLEAAAETIDLWSEDLDFEELAEDAAIEARLALRLGEELRISTSGSRSSSPRPIPAES